jgi:cytochrome c biogenesis protein CcmG, thiol:disulfide interchange protein DsbE
VEISVRKPATTLLTFALLAGLGGAPKVLEAQVAVGAQPDFTLPTLQSDPIALSALRGSVVLVDFWATWCAPCRESFPFYAELVERYGERGFRVVAVSVDEDPGALARFVERTAPPFAIVWDERHRVVEQFAPAGMPTSYLLDRTGLVRRVTIGFDDDHRQAIEADVAALLAEPVPETAAWTAP